MFAVMMDRLTDVIRYESPWTMVFTGDIVLYSELRRAGGKEPGEKRNEIQ